MLIVFKYNKKVWYLLIFLKIASLDEMFGICKNKYFRAGIIIVQSKIYKLL